MICSGAGTGKSRLLDEFQRLCVDVMLPIDQRLGNIIKEAYVFKVDLANGTSAGRFDDPMHYITSRMYHQIIDPPLDWDSMSTAGFPHITFGNLVSKLSQSELKDIKNMSIMILVDGLHKLEHVSGSRTSILYGALSRLANWSNTSGRGNNPFVIVCVSATRQEPISTFLAGTRQLRLFLRPPSINGNAIIHPRNDVDSMMLLDMGGHPYAIEVLLQKIEKYRDDDNCSASTVMSEVCSFLKSMYRGWETPGMYLPALRAILLGTTFNSVESKLQDLTIDQYQELGLVEWNPTTKVLMCPFVWLRIVTEGNRQLRKIMDFSSIERHHTPYTMPLDVTWQHWEDFIARFWCLKTMVFDGLTIPWQSLHHGALFKKTCDYNVPVKRLQLVTATNKCSTNSTLTAEIPSDAGTIKPIKGNHHVISAYANPGADHFVSCHLSHLLPFPCAANTSQALGGKVSTNKSISKLQEAKRTSSSSIQLVVTLPLLLMICQMTSVVWFVRKTSKVILGPTLGEPFSSRICRHQTSTLPPRVFYCLLME